MESRKILPIDKRSEKPYWNDDSLDCLDDFDDKYKIGNPKDYVTWIDNYHRALEAAEKEIDRLNRQLKN